MKRSEEIKEQIKFATEYYHKVSDGELKLLIQDRITKLDAEYTKALKEEANEKEEVLRQEKESSEHKEIPLTLYDWINCIGNALTEVLKENNESRQRRKDYIEPKDRVDENPLTNAKKFVDDFINDEIGEYKLNYEIDKEVLINFLCYVFTKIK